MDTRTRFLTFIAPLLIAGQAWAIDLPSLGVPMVATARNIVSDAGTTILASTNDGKLAQSMIEKLGSEAISAIADKSLDENAKKKVFQRILTKNFDMATIGRFAMGKYWRQATPAQQAEYSGLYQRMIIDVYTARFNNYTGQAFNVTGNRIDESGDIVVSSKIASNDSAPVAVDWRVRPKGGTYRIIDVMVEGVSMAVTQRNDFAGIIQQGGGTIDALLAYLKKGGTSDVKK